MFVKIRFFVTSIAAAAVIINSNFSALNANDSDEFGFKNTDLSYSLIAGDSLDFSDAYFVDEKGDQHEIYAAPNINTYKTGTYELTLMAKNDPENHSKKVTVHVSEMPCEVKLKDGFYDEENDRCNFRNGRTQFWSTGYYNTDAGTTNLKEIAEKLVGVGGTCQSIVFRFYTYLYQKNIEYLEPEWVVYEEAVPGDFIFYQNGGRGNSHVAVYLGDGMALQGNWLGAARIESIYLPNATQPIFAHPNIVFAE